MAKTIQILLLDDEVGLLETLAEFLSDCGYTVHPVTEAENASALLLQGIVDLAVLDVGAHGLRVAREAATRGVPTILMSGHPVIIENGTGGDVMRKPFSLAALQANIEAALAAHGRGGLVEADRAMEPLAPACPPPARSGAA